MALDSWQSIFYAPMRMWQWSWTALSHLAEAVA
jgi:hypothetical protein